MEALTQGLGPTVPHYSGTGPSPISVPIALIVNKPLGINDFKLTILNGYVCKCCWLQGCERLGEAVISIDVNADIRTVIDQKGTGPNQPEQLLCDYFVSLSLIKSGKRTFIKSCASHAVCDR